MGSFEKCDGSGSSALLEPSCGYLLQELEMIWDEVGEDKLAREKILLELEQECLEVYRRKVDTASILRARLHQQLAEAEAEFTHLLLSLGERSLPGRPDKISGTLKEQLNSITPALREMQLRKEERVKQFRLVQGKILKISAEIAGLIEYNDTRTVFVNENDLSSKKLEEFQNELQGLNKEKSERLQRVENYISTIRNLSETLGMDSSQIITKAHPSLNELSGLPKNISDNILAKLDSTVKSLEAEKNMRLDKLQQLGKALVNFWNLMDTPDEERQHFIHVTSISSDEISASGILTLDIIQQAKTEVERLDQLKSSKIKEFFFQKQIELEDVCSRSHMEVPTRSEMENIITQINSGEIDHVNLLASMDEQISRAEEEASSRKAIMEKVEKWILARDEERWLEEYSRDENRYSVSRGTHKNLRRAERARVMVNKIPALVNLLISKTKQWEEEKKKDFMYDKVPLLSTLEEYDVQRKEREEEKQRQREQKKAQNRAVTEHEGPFGSRPGTSSRFLSDRTLNRGVHNATPPIRKSWHSLQHTGPNSNIMSSPTQTMSIGNGGNKAFGQRVYAQKGFATHLREDSVSVVSSYSGPVSP